MKRRKTEVKLAILSILLAVFFLSASNAFALCDTLTGPVVAEARKALSEGEIQPLMMLTSLHT